MIRAILFLLLFNTLAYAEIPQNILDGRGLVEQYRLDHKVLYTDKDESFSTKTISEKQLIEKDIRDNHKPLLDNLIKDLKTLGFESLNDFFNKSIEADKKEGLKWEEYWR